MRRIGILLFDGVEELDAVGPWEVLAAWTQGFPDDGYEVRTLAHGVSPVRCAKGMVIQADEVLADAAPYEVIVHPGGRGARVLMRDEEHLAWVRRQRREVPLMTSVCSGALVYAAAGLLAGRPATTYWDAMDLLTELDPTITARPADRFVDDGDVITSAGVSAGIDMALHLVARLAGTPRAREVRRLVQYDPQPPV